MVPIKKYGLAHTLRHLRAGQSLMRILMNRELSKESLRGRVADIGGGHNPDYFDYFQIQESMRLERIDGSFSGIDFEKDPLPFASAALDTVILCNVLEHVYNYRFLLAEVHRVLAGGGRLVGVVPFWVGYHPDPHDYFRYTYEALHRILAEAGFSGIDVRPIGGGPLLANFNTIVLSVPRFLRPLLYLWYAPLNRIFVRLRPNSARRQPLGFVFTASK
jgi:SAM-dependent methyltransferase